MAVRRPGRRQSWLALAMLGSEPVLSCVFNFLPTKQNYKAFCHPLNCHAHLHSLRKSSLLRKKIEWRPKKMLFSSSSSIRMTGKSRLEVHRKGSSRGVCWSTIYCIGGRVRPVTAWPAQLHTALSMSHFPQLKIGTSIYVVAQRALVGLMRSAV